MEFREPELPIRVNVTQGHIDRHGSEINNSRDCPIFHALKDMGYNVRIVTYDHVCLEYGVSHRQLFRIPPSAMNWQVDHLLIPISFEISEKDI